MDKVPLLNPKPMLTMILKTHLSLSVRLFWMMLLFTYAGTIEVTEMPNGFSSIASASVMFSTAALLPCCQASIRDQDGIYITL